MKIYIPVQSVRDLWVGISNVDHNVTNSVHLWPIYQFQVKGKLDFDFDFDWGVRTFKLNAWGSEADVVTANCKNVKIANKEIQNTSRPTSLQFLLEPLFLFSEPTASTSTKLTFSQQVAFICFNPQSIVSSSDLHSDDYCQPSCNWWLGFATRSWVIWECRITIFESYVEPSSPNQIRVLSSYGNRIPTQFE